MPAEPEIKRTYAFFDGQALYHAAKEAFGYTYPHYAPGLLAGKICAQKNWRLDQIYFYTGIPSAGDNSFWNHFWTAKMAVMGTRGIHTFCRELRYRNQRMVLPDGSVSTVLVGQEKGIDIRIALDIVRFAPGRLFDVALIFSQDQDLSEMAAEVRKISMEQSRWIKVASAYPMSPTSHNKRGINNTEWIQIERKFYDSCIDPMDYRPKKDKTMPLFPK